MKLLLVEDNPTIQTTLRRAFERRGMQVIGCEDGARALDRWEASMPDVVLLDLSLPGPWRRSASSCARSARRRTGSERSRSCSSGNPCHVNESVPSLGRSVTAASAPRSWRM
jgi:CheY-like chemotaxis protein